MVNFYLGYSISYWAINLLPVELATICSLTAYNTKNLHFEFIYFFPWQDKRLGGDQHCFLDPVILQYFQKQTVTEALPLGRLTSYLFLNTPGSLFLSLRANILTGRLFESTKVMTMPDAISLSIITHRNAI